MRAMIFALLLGLLLASNPACAAIDTTTELETTTRTGELQGNIKNMTVKVLVMVQSGGRVLSKHGTGVIVGYADGFYLAITAHHVVTIRDPLFAKAPVCYNIEHPAMGNIRAYLIRQDDDEDLALLAFPNRVRIPVAVLVEEEPPLLSIVYHYGFGGMWFEGPFMSKGILSSKDRMWPAQPGVWTIQCPVWYGCSGGGVFLKNGRLLGMVVLRDPSIYGGWMSAFVPYKTIAEFLKDFNAEEIIDE